MRSWAILLYRRQLEDPEVVAVVEPDRVVCKSYGVVVERFPRQIPFLGIPNAVTTYPWHRVILVEELQ